MIQLTEREESIRRLHVDTGEGTLEDMVDDLTDQAWHALGAPEANRGGEDWTRLRTALHRRLEDYIVAFDVCGLSVFCHEVEPIDPWR